jgi:phenylalanine-4-hydroxylase
MNCLFHNASDIRQLEHIEYTPAPDIIHEGAGHAPLLRILNMQNTYAVLERYAKQFLRTKTTKWAIRLLSIVKRPTTHKRLMLKKAVEDLQ